MRTIILLLCFSAVAFGQCGSAGQLIWNPVSNQFGCTGLAGVGLGSVTSVGLVGTADQVTVTGASPITTTGSWTLSLPAAAKVAGSDKQIQYNNNGAFGGMAGTAWTDATRDLSFKDVNLNELFSFTSDPVGNSGTGAYFYLNAASIAAPSVADENTLDGAYVELDAINGGGSSLTTTVTGGNGGGMFLYSGAGAAISSANTAATAGRGGNAGLTARYGGAATGAGNNHGGRGGNLGLVAGDAGSASGGTSNTGGNGGTVTFTIGSGGTGGTANGLDGTLYIQAGARANAPIFKIQSNGGAADYVVVGINYMQIVAIDVASLQTCNGGLEGARASVNNSNAVSFTLGIGAVVAGGGTTHVPVYCDGTNWRIG